jgi:hypothetical protein
MNTGDSCSEKTRGAIDSLSGSGDRDIHRDSGSCVTIATKVWDGTVTARTNVYECFYIKDKHKWCWFQDKPYHKHYDVTPSKRALAVKAGAIEVSQREYAKRVSTNPALHRLIAENEAAEAAED